ncbi:extracellular solute-binding protein [Nocardioides antri]|uniref:Extracellular solute-binding protein n=1 Tax=Nocardioides antri TaxID=2607659 RepID=A0A5B1M1C5_9ACTN|nr:extracellular solute-binding protein [Nocardioides antri]KAA1425909.1 extracellular solute-binding protein [Nocardioides antri]
MFSLGRFDWRTSAAVVVVAIAVVVAMVLYSDGEGPVRNGGDGPTTSTHGMSRLVFAVWGNDAEVAAYREVVEDYNHDSTVVDVHVEAWPDAKSMLADIRSGEVTPDLYLLPRDELAETLEADRNRPLLDLLDPRGVSFGDEFPRDVLSAFAAEDNLQCMPYASSPMVIYYNTDLIDFEKMANRDLPVPPEDQEYWSLEMFRAAATFASRPRMDSKGVYIEPTLEGLAPFVYAGGGQLFDDEGDPSSLALSDEDSVDSLRQTLEVLRDPTITLTNRQVRQKTALEWFQDGRLGMIAGYRDLTPVLRETEGLDFDVMPMPELDGDATVGDLIGVCVADGPQERVEQSADFLVNLLSNEALSTIASTGYLMPTKIDVAFSDAFLQPGRQPANARAFVAATRSIVLPPLLDVWPQLEAAVDPDLTRLLTQPLFEEELDAELEAIDEKSKAVLDPEETEPTDEQNPSGSVTSTP